MHRLRQIWITIASSLWFVPLTMVGGAIALAIAFTLVDFAIGDEWTQKRPVLFGVGADGARGMLAAIAGSMITVASLTFSLTISTLAITASQYSSRLVRNFMRDRVNQFVLGYFVGLFAYCLVVLRSIRSGDDAEFVPPIAVLSGLLLALFSIIVLIIFIHHIAESIQASSILRRVARETLEAIEDLFPSRVGDPAGEVDASKPTPSAGAGAVEVAAGAFGYIQDVNAEALLEIAQEQDALIVMRADVGDFVTGAGALCEVARTRGLADDDSERIRGAFNIGAVRTIEQDAAFGARQIVDIALRALSPGVNDTTTAVMCVQHLSVALEALADRQIPDRFRAADGVIRLVAADRSFHAFASLCLDQIRQSAAGNPAVMRALLRAIAAAGRRAGDPDRRAALIRHADLVADLAQETLRPHEREPIRDLAAEVAAELKQPF